MQLSLYIYKNIHFLTHFLNYAHKPNSHDVFPMAWLWEKHDSASMLNMKAWSQGNAI